ncbi:hypothetical protein TNCV_1505841 [Trichonephila clavipes]|nr:hypothetical protein TNCV_1505841 [Trichonephila clavipes]
MQASHSCSPWYLSIQKRPSGYYNSIPVSSYAIEHSTARLMSGKKHSVQVALDLLQSQPSEISEVLTDDFLDEEIPTNKLLEFLLDS